MYKSSSEFLAESHGLAVGKSNGLRLGLEEGFQQGWQAAIGSVASQQRKMEAQHAELCWGVNSLSVITYAALKALGAAPNQYRNLFVAEYAKEVERLIEAGPATAGAIRGLPHLDRALITRETDLAQLVKTWFEQGVSRGKKTSG